ADLVPRLTVILATGGGNLCWDRPRARRMGNPTDRSRVDTSDRRTALPGAPTPAPPPGETRPFARPQWHGRPAAAGRHATPQPAALDRPAPAPPAGRRAGPAGARAGGAGAVRPAGRGARGPGRHPARGRLDPRPG